MANNFIEKKVCFLKDKLFVFFSLAVFLIYLSGLAPGITWTEESSDSAELVLAAAELGIAHPPSYPAYILIAHLWQKILFFAESAFALNVFSAFCTSLAAYFLLKTLSRILADNPYKLKNWIYPLAAASFTVSYLVWSNALITEVYAFSLAYLTGIFYLLSDSSLFQSSRKIVLLGFLLGFATGVNPVICLLYLVLLKPISLKKFLIFHAAIALGLAILLYIPLRAAANPLANWGRVDSLERFVWLITAAQYQQFFSFNINYFSELFRVLKILLLNSQIWGILFFPFGLKFLWQASRTFCVSLLFMLFLAIHQFIFYPVEGRSSYLLPAILVIVIVAATGVIQSLTVLGLRWQKLTIQLIMIAIIVNCFVLYSFLDRSSDTEAWDFGRTVLEQIPPESLILTDSDRETFSLWYAQYQLRADVVIIDTRLLQYDWYRENLAVQYPQLNPNFIRLGGLTGLGMDIYTIEWGETGYGLERTYPE